MGATGWARDDEQGTPAWEDRVLQFDPKAGFGKGTRKLLIKTQAEIRAKRAAAANAAAREALATPPVSAAEVAGRYGAANRARTRARAGVPPSIGRPGGGPSAAGGPSY